jgi:hypothetical protein
MLPSARDYQELANAAFKKPVPSELIQYMQKNKEIRARIFTNLTLINGQSNGTSTVTKRIKAGTSIFLWGNMGLNG